MYEYFPFSHLFLHKSLRQQQVKNLKALINFNSELNALKTTQSWRFKVWENSLVTAL